MNITLAFTFVKLKNHVLYKKLKNHPLIRSIFLLLSQKRQKLTLSPYKSVFHSSLGFRKYHKMFIFYFFVEKKNNRV